MRQRRGEPWPARLSPMLALGLLACSEVLDAGSTRPHGTLPVDERNPIIITNDNVGDNWQGEYALLLSNGGGPKLAGILINTSGPWPELDANVEGWRGLVEAARASGLEAPDPTTSVGERLVRPGSGRIEDTEPNRSEGALFIIEASRRLSLPYRPLVIVTGGRLTDVADAYLVDPTVADRIVVVSSLGKTSDSGAVMGPPNGEMDPWAGAIVTARLKYVQVSSFYDQLMDVPASRVSELPDNAFGAWIADKRARIWNLPEASDQVAVAAVGITGFALKVERISATSLAANSGQGPDLTRDPDGPAWLVSDVEGTEATAGFWRLLSELRAVPP
ncbi:MAG TPA: hypothetical protein VFQ61_16605 [Polyangiaceae bacterium]|nr:hypothetical protein [Polyangiaceae bacterium]